MVIKSVLVSGLDFVQSVDVKKCKGSIVQVQKQLQGFYKQCALLRPILEVDSVCRPRFVLCKVLSASQTPFHCFQPSVHRRFTASGHSLRR